MINKDDVKRLIKAHKLVQSALQEPDKTLAQKILNPLTPNPGKVAAGILCSEMGWLANQNEPFWNELREASTRLAVHKALEKVSFSKIEDLLKAEAEVFHKLGIDPDSTATVLAHAYGALRIVNSLPDPTPAALDNLRDRLKVTTRLICDASEGTLERTFGKLISLKGANVLGGAAVAGGNVAVAVFDQGILSWISLKAGYHIMRGEYEELWKIITGEDPSGPI